MKEFIPRLKIFSISFGIIAFLILLFWLSKTGKYLPNDAASFDLKDINKRGKIIAIVDRNSIDYYIYKGRPMGFQLDMLRKFSDHILLPLEIIVEDNYSKSLQLLNSAKCDVIASNITVLKERKKHFTFSEPIIQTRQVLIQRKKNNEDTAFIKNVLDLRHKTVNVKTNSAFHDRLVNLSEEIGDTIYIMDKDSYTTEMLIKQVSMGLIDYTVANEHVARVNAQYYSNIDYSIPLSFEQNTAWVLRKNSPTLEIVLNKWLQHFKEGRYFSAIYHKYFESERQILVFNSEYCSINGNKISQYDEAIKQYSDIIDWDWRLLASLIYQESKFNNDTMSHRGAFGLMQLMPITAQKFDIDTISTPEENIRAGVMYIRWLDRQLTLSVKDSEERKKFILAAYNVGLGHIYDCQALAKKHGKDPQKWEDNVDYYLLNKANPLYLNDTLVRNGTLKGKETYVFVKKVMERYRHYKNLIEK